MSLYNTLSLSQHAVYWLYRQLGSLRLVLDTPEPYMHTATDDGESLSFPGTTTDIWQS